MGPIEIDNEGQRVRIGGGTWRSWTRDERLAHLDGWAAARCGLVVEQRGTEHYREFYDCGYAAGRAYAGGEAA